MCALDRPSRRMIVKSYGPILAFLLFDCGNNFHVSKEARRLRPDLTFGL